MKAEERIEILVEALKSIDNMNTLIYTGVAPDSWDVSRRINNRILQALREAKIEGYE